MVRKIENGVSWISKFKGDDLTNCRIDSQEDCGVSEVNIVALAGISLVEVNQANIGLVVS